MKPFLLLLILLPFVVFAQFSAPDASPSATNTTSAGYTELSINYHRPNVRARVVFGELLPWNEVWRAGANENTLLTIDGSITIGDTNLEKGTYSLYLIPEERGEWTWIVNRATDNWGSRGYTQSRDLLRQKGKATKLPERIETLEYRWMNVSPQSIDLVVEWEWYRIALTIKLPTDDQVADRAALELNPAQDPNEYYAAARYYQDNGPNLQKAKAWIDRWAATSKEQFGRTRYQAIIEHQMGNKAKGKRLMERSLEMAREAKNDHYVRMNEQSLRDWTRDRVEISADSVLTRSIRYHDPEGTWAKRSHLIQLAESRPNGTVHQTRLTFYPATNEFEMNQTRGRDKIQIRLRNNSYSFSHQGRTEISAEAAKKFSLTEEGTRRLRDYYTYLFGLPMKLRDEGTLVQPAVHTTWYDGREMLELEIHYAPETGKDIWFFYFDPETYAMSGYSFYHEKDGPGTGEYILLEGEVSVGKMKLPAERHWYLTKNKLYLGTDEIID
jgi:hypothetical protein